MARSFVEYMEIKLKSSGTLYLMCTQSGNLSNLIIRITLAMAHSQDVDFAWYVALAAHFFRKVPCKHGAGAHFGSTRVNACFLGSCFP